MDLALTEAFQSEWIKKVNAGAVEDLHSSEFRYQRREGYPL